MIRSAIVSIMSPEMMEEILGLAGVDENEARRIRHQMEFAQKKAMSDAKPTSIGPRYYGGHAT